MIDSRTFSSLEVPPSLCPLLVRQAPDYKRGSWCWHSDQTCFFLSSSSSSFLLVCAVGECDCRQTPCFFPCSLRSPVGLDLQQRAHQLSVLYRPFTPLTAPPKKKTGKKDESLGHSSRFGCLRGKLCRARDGAVLGALPKLASGLFVLL